MIFTSVIFIIFFLILYILYWSVPGKSWKLYLLFIASMIFYGSWSFPFLLHFLTFIGINYLFVLWLLRGSKKYIVTIAIIINLLNLGFFKYFYFFTRTIGQIFGMENLTRLDQASFKIILPLAISFYTFQMLAYVIDVYRGDIKEGISLFNFALFILFFPQLVAGPIMRSTDFIWQLKNKAFNPDYIAPGLFFILSGIIKKVLLADQIAAFIDPIWTNPGYYNGLSNLIASFGFSFQVYCDFSGYTDIAIGSAYLLGFSIPDNFAAPFLAEGPRDLWKRWHITLSSWLRDYLYIPLGGSRTSETRSYFNLITTFTLGGLWHGANWTYIAWGFFHGVMLALERILEKIGILLTPKNWIGKPLRIIGTFSIFTAGVIFFRAHSISDALTVFYKMFTFSSSGNSVSGMETILYLFLGSYLIQIPQYLNSRPAWADRYKQYLLPLSYLILMFVCGLYSRSGKEFVYFQF